MARTDLIIVWAVFAPTAIILIWWFTKNEHSIHIRATIRSLVIAFSSGFAGVGTDSAAIVIPLWSLVTPRANFVGLYGIGIWWAIVLICYYACYFVYQKIKNKR